MPTDSPPGHGSGSGAGSGSGSGSGSNNNPCSFSGALATWDLSAQAGTEASVAATATGVTAGSLTRAATLTAQSGAGSINGSNWPTAAALDATKYYAFTLTAPTGCTSITLTNVAIDLKASGTGPASGAIATSKDSFAATTAVSTAAPSTPAVTVTTSGQLELRVYGYAATGTGGTLRIQNTLTVHGTIQ